MNGAGTLGAAGPSLSGTVQTQSDDRPVGNATVQLQSVDYQNLTGTAAEQEARAEDIITDFGPGALPDNWSRYRTLPVSTLVENRTGTTYVAANSPGDWDLAANRIRDSVSGETLTIREPKLGPEASNGGGPYGAQRVAPPGEPIVLHCRDASDSPLIQDSVDADLPGVTEDCSIVIEQLGPSTDGGTVATDTRTLDTDQSIGGGAIQKEHFYTTATLSTGLYRIYPEGNQAGAYVLAVGNSRTAAEGALTAWENDLRTEQEQLTEYANQLRAFQANNTVRNTTGAADADGKFNITLNSATVNETAIIAYRGPNAISTDPQNVTREEVRNYYDGLNVSDLDGLNDVPGSMYISAGPTTTTAPASNVRVEVVEISAAPYVGLNQTQELWDQYAQALYGRNFGELTGATREYLISLNDSQLRTRLADLQEQADDSEDTVPNAPINADPDELNRDELLDNISRLEGEIAELQDSIDAEANVTDRSEQNVSVAFEFDRELQREDIDLYAVYTNGTRRAVADEYVSLDDGLIGGTTVTITDYPTPDGSTAGVTFAYSVLDDGDKGDGRQFVRNPSFTGTLPALRNVDFSSLSPGVDESVTVSAEGRQNTDYGALEAVDVTAPDGTAVSTTTSGGEATFEPTQQGRHTVAVTYSNSGGQNITQRYQLNVLANDIDTPATVRAANGLTGPVALTGADLTGGEIQQRAGRTNVLALIGPSDDPPPTIHSHVETLDQPPTSTTCTRVAQEPDETNVRQRTTVITHVGELPEDSYVYRVAEESDNTLQPMTEDGNAYGSVDRTDNGTAISTYTESDGGVCVRVIAQPDLGDDVQWQVQTALERIPSVPGVDVVSGGGLMALLGAGLLVGRYRGGADR